MSTDQILSIVHDAVTVAEALLKALVGGRTERIPMIIGQEGPTTLAKMAADARAIEKFPDE